MRDFTRFVGKPVRVLVLQLQHVQVFLGVLDSANMYELILRPLDTDSNNKPMTFIGLSPGIDGVTSIPLDYNPIITELDQKYIIPEPKSRKK
jgi:hypothetical protein